MAQNAEQDVKKLFKAWRGGDAASGQLMAQRFSDWYYAIAAHRLGDTQGREPLERACQSFAQGIMTVTRTSELIDWAHGLILREVTEAGGRVNGGDFPNALTANRSPVALLQQCRVAMDPDKARLLAMAFDSSVSLEALTEEAEAQGGMPLALLDARYEVKRLLRDHAQVPLAVVPDSANLDRAPLPIYESARMKTEAEEAAFEKWVVSDLDLCKDVAEFATFTHALRVGAFSGPMPQAAPAESAAPQVSAAMQAEADGTPAKSSSVGKILLVVGLLGLLALGAVAAGVLFFMRG